MTLLLVILGALALLAVVLYNRLVRLGNKFHTRPPVIKQLLYREVSKDGGWFPRQPDRVRASYAAMTA